jgi:hypothetical protein
MQPQKMCLKARVQLEYLKRRNKAESARLRKQVKHFKTQIPPNDLEALEASHELQNVQIHFRNIKSILQRIKGDAMNSGAGYQHNQHRPHKMFRLQQEL